MKTLFKLPSLAFSAISMIIHVPVAAAGPAETDDEATDPTGGEACIPPSVQKAVTTCDPNIKLGRFDGVSKPKIGTKKIEATKKKLKKPPAPSLQRQFAKDITESAFKRKRENKRINILKEELKLLVRLADSTSNDDPDKADVLKRVADGYKSYSDQLNFLARDLDEKMYQAQKKGDKQTVARFKAQQKKLDQMATESREAMIKAYVQIKNNFPEYPDYDEILFAIAYELNQLAIGLEDEDKASAYRARAREFYNELIRNHQRSRFIPHAWMSYGDYYFNEAKDPDKANRSYQKVTQWGADENPNYVIALYYQAWCLFNMQQYEDTITKFIEVMEFARLNSDEKEARAVAKRSALELVDAYAKIGNPSQAWTFFQRVGGDSAHAMLDKLANVYYDDGQWQSAIVVLHKLEALEVENQQKNNGDDLCAYQHLVTNAVIASRPKEEQLKEMQRQLGVYKKFIKDGNHDPEKVKQCAQKTAEMTWDQATHWHVEAVGTNKSPGSGNADTMTVTVGLYETILNTFDDLDNLDIPGFDEETRPTKYRVAYYIADLYWTMEKWDKCGPAFDQVVELNPTGEFTADAAYGAVLCYNKVYAEKKGKGDTDRRADLRADPSLGENCGPKCKKCQKKCRGRDKTECKAACFGEDKVVLKPMELSDLDKGILRSYDRYVCYVKNGQDLVNIKYRRARIYYEANHFAEASVLFRDIAINHPDSELAIFSANLHLDCLNALGDMVEPPLPQCYDDLADVVDIFIDTSKSPGQILMKDEAFASQIKSLKVGVMRKKAESLNKRKRFKEAAEIYLAIYRDYFGIYDDNGMCEVLFNTAINMEAARLVMPAILVRKKMIDAYPECEHSKKAAYYIGQNYHALQIFNTAAAHYYQFAKKYPGEAEAPEALSSAIMFYIGLGDYEQAWSTVRMFEKLYKTEHPQKTATVFFSSGFIYLNEAEGKKGVDYWEPVRKHYNQYLKRYGHVKALDEQVQARVFMGDSYWFQRPKDWDRAEREYKKALAIFSAKAMDRVSENSRKAEMLNAAAKARFHLAERTYYEFRKIRFPEFNPEKEVPKRVERWWKKKVGKEEVARFEEVRKYRRILVLWGEMERKEAKQETKKEDASKQFDYWLEHRFKPWMERKTKALEEANKLFAAVVEMHVPEWEMAASARAADMQMSFMNDLYDAPLPPAFKGDEELTTIYRQSMDEKAQPFRDVAIKLYEHCLNVSTKVRWFNDNSIRCEEELNKLDPHKFPVSEEIRIQPDSEMVILDIPGPILEQPNAATKREAELKSGARALIQQPAAEETGEAPPEGAPPEGDSSAPPAEQTGEPDAAVAPQ